MDETKWKTKWYGQSDNIKMDLIQTGYENVDGFIWIMIWNSG
jgi:hypothetical protein